LLHLTSLNYPFSGPPHLVIGPYRLVAEVGRGGMGVVDKAEDTRLHPLVALKVLPHDVGEKPETPKRVRREAQAASALNHPNICTPSGAATRSMFPRPRLDVSGVQAPG